MLVTPMLVAALALGQSNAYVRSRATANDPNSQCLFWTVPTIEWNLSSVGNPKSSDAQKQNEFAAIRASFQSWQDIFAACGNLSFQEGPLVDDRKVGYEMKGPNRNIVLFRSIRCSDVLPSTDPCWKEETCGNKRDCWDGTPSTIALTLTTYDENSGIIYDSDIELNAAGYVFTTVGPPAPTCSLPVTGSPTNCVATDVQNTMTHEIGHLIGLDHILLRGSTMYPEAPPGETAMRTIDQGSRDFVCATYPKGQPSQSCFTPTVSASGNVAALGPEASGCSSSGAEAWLPALAGWGVLAWRRRRGGARR